MRAGADKHLIRVLLRSSVVLFHELPPWFFFLRIHLLLLLAVIKRKIMWWTVIILSVALAAVCTWLARMDYTQMKVYIDSHAPDGNVESFDPPFHARMQAHLKVVAGIFAMFAVGLAMARRFLFSAAERQAGQMALFRADLLKGWRTLVDRTGPGHKRFVLFVVVVGTLLRLSQMGAGVIYDEAFTYTNYASQPFHFLLSNYTYPNNHILHTLLVKCSTAVFGVHLWSLRLPALLAGIAVMPLFYVIVRQMFNRYIGLIALSFVASSGALIEYSTVARGYSLTWLFMVCAMIAGRHLVKRNNTVSALLVALFNTLGMWAVPTMVYAALATYIWLFLYMVTTYDSTLRKRLPKLLWSLVTFLLMTALVYTPVIVVHSVDQLVHHPTMGENTWESFVATHQDKAFELWAYFNDTAATWISIAGIIGLVYAAWISMKYRLMIAALLLAAIPMVIAQSMIGPPRVWTYVLFNLHLSSAIAVFYALKFIQDKVYAGFEKGFRTLVACFIVLAGMGWLGITGVKDRLERFTDARLAADWCDGVLKPGDRVLTEFPNEAPFEFELITNGMDRAYVNRGPAPGGRTYVLVGPADGQTIESVLQRNSVRTIDPKMLVKVQDWRRLEIFAAP